MLQASRYTEALGILPVPVYDSQDLPDPQQSGTEYGSESADPLPYPDPPKLLLISGTNINSVPVPLTLIHYYCTPVFAIFLYVA